MKEVMFVLPVMHGGGAERVAALIANEMHTCGIKVTFVLTSDTEKQVIRTDLSAEIPLIILPDLLGEESAFSKIRYRISGLLASALCKPFELLKKPVSADLAKLSLSSEYHNEIQKMKEILTEHQKATVISFLQPSIPITLLAAKRLSNKIVLSERGDPQRLMKKRYGKKFIEKYYQRADKIVFQTEDAKKAYPESLSEKGVILSNPIKANLPAPYHGERNKNITTFCRISKQKNLPNLLQAFLLVHQKHPDYRLRIIGDTFNQEGESVLEEIKEFISFNRLENAVKFEAFMDNVHQAIIKDAMYINSSDYEGISNAMLEAMAIGMPVVCTDCPIGGAKATINDGENGLLVPIRDPKKLAEAVDRVIEDKDLSNKLSANASQIRDHLSLDSITDQWMKLV